MVIFLAYFLDYFAWKDFLQRLLSKMLHGGCSETTALTLCASDSPIRIQGPVDVVNAFSVFFICILRDQALILMGHQDGHPNES